MATRQGRGKSSSSNRHSRNGKVTKGRRRIVVIAGDDDEEEEKDKDSGGSSGGRGSGRVRNRRRQLDSVVDDIQEFAWSEEDVDAFSKPISFRPQPFYLNPRTKRMEVDFFELGRAVVEVAYRFYRNAL